MKALALGLALLLLVPIGCGRKDKDEKGALDTFTDYATGKTPIEAGNETKRKLIWISIENAVNGYRGLEGSDPASLQQLVEARYLDPKCAEDELGKPLQSSVKDGKLVVRSVRSDGTLNWEKAF